MCDKILILLVALSEDLESLGSQHGSLLQLSPSLLLKRVLLVSEEVLPLVEAVAHVCLAVLLTVRQEVEPVLHDLAELDEPAPSVKHLRLQVVICSIAVLPASH